MTPVSSTQNGSPTQSQGATPASPSTNPQSSTTQSTQKVAQPILNALPPTRHGLAWGHPSHPGFQDGGSSRYDINL